MAALPLIELAIYTFLYYLQFISAKQKKICGCNYTHCEQKHGEPHIEAWELHDKANREINHTVFPPARFISLSADIIA
jgi:hypothetical protein